MDASSYQNNSEQTGLALSVFDPDEFNAGSSLFGDYTVQGASANAQASVVQSPAQSVVPPQFAFDTEASQQAQLARDMAWLNSILNNPPAPINSAPIPTNMGPGASYNWPDFAPSAMMTQNTQFSMPPTIITNSVVYLGVPPPSQQTWAPVPSSSTNTYAPQGSSLHQSQDAWTPEMLHTWAVNNGYTLPARMGQQVATSSTLLPSFGEEFLAPSLAGIHSSAVLSPSKNANISSQGTFNLETIPMLETTHEDRRKLVKSRERVRRLLAVSEREPFTEESGGKRLHATMPFHSLSAETQLDLLRAHLARCEEKALTAAGFPAGWQFDLPLVFGNANLATWMPLSGPAGLFRCPFNRTCPVPVFNWPPFILTHLRKHHLSSFNCIDSIANVNMECGLRTEPDPKFSGSSGGHVCRAVLSMNEWLNHIADHPGHMWRLIAQCMACGDVFADKEALDKHTNSQDCDHIWKGYDDFVEQEVGNADEDAVDETDADEYISTGASMLIQ